MKTPRDRVLDKLSHLKGFADVVAFDATNAQPTLGSSYAELRRRTRKLGKAMRRWQRERGRPGDGRGV